MFTLNTQDELLSIDQLCERLFISPTTAYRLLQTGEIKAFKLGTWKIPGSSVQEFVERRCIKT